MLSIDIAYLFREIYLTKKTKKIIAQTFKNIDLKKNLELIL